MTTSRDTTALFGKVPGHGDFVRIGSVGSGQVAFETWITESIAQSRGGVPHAPVRFLFAPEPGGPRLVGVFVESRDSVGRTFPLAVLRRVPDALAKESISLLVALYDSFLDAAELALRDGFEQSLEARRDALARLPDPTPSFVQEMVRAGREVLAAEPVSTFASRVFGHERSDPLPYALLALGQAGSSDEDELVLDAPIREHLDVYVWLELLRATTVAHDLRALFWSIPLERALLQPSCLSRNALAFLVDAGHPSRYRWPLWSENAEATIEAREALSPALASALSGATTLQALIDAMSPGEQPS